MLRLVSNKRSHRRLLSNSVSKFETEMEADLAVWPEFIRRDTISAGRRPVHREHSV
jgi:hypothetical protein